VPAGCVRGAERDFVLACGQAGGYVQSLRCVVPVFFPSTCTIFCEGTEYSFISVLKKNKFFLYYTRFSLYLQ
jgi:hypothetical protein